MKLKRFLLSIGLILALALTAGATDFLPWSLNLGGGGNARQGEIPLLTSLPNAATITGGPQYCEDNAETLKTAGADEPQFPGMRLSGTDWLPTASDGAKNHPTISGVPQFYPNRQEYEDVGPTSEFRTTKGDTTESLDHYYKSDAITSSAKTSLTPLPRDSSGRFYENLVKNGGFNVDAEWTKGTGVTIGSGVASWDGTQTADSDLSQAISLNANTTYRSIVTTSSVSAGNLTPVVGGVEGTDRATSDTFTETITTGSSPTTILLRADADFVGSVDDFYVTEVDALGNPTNILDGGWRENTTNLLTYSEDFTGWVKGYGDETVTLNQATAPDGNITGTEINIPTDDNSRVYKQLTGLSIGQIYTWSVFIKAKTGQAGTAPLRTYNGSYTNHLITVDDSAWVRADIQVEAQSSNVYMYFTRRIPDETLSNFYVWGAQFVTGTETAEYIPTTSATVTQPANVDDAVVWQYAGRYQDRVGYLSEEARTNLFLNSQAPVTQTIDLTAIGTGDYTLSTYGTGTATVAAGTATGTGFGASSDGTDTTFNLSVVGTVVVTIAGGPPDWVQVEAGSFTTSPIITEASTVARPATICEIPSSRYIRANDFAAQGYCIPEGAGQTGTIWSSYTDANNYTSLGISATEVILNKRISGTSHTATVTYSHAKDTLFEWQAFFDSTDGIGLRTREWDGLVWGAWEFFATDATATDIAVPANIQIGSIDDGAQFNGTIPHIAFKKTSNPRLYFVDQQEFKTSGGETFKTSDGDTFIVYGD